MKRVAAVLLAAILLLGSVNALAWIGDVSFPAEIRAYIDEHLSEYHTTYDEFAVMRDTGDCFVLLRQANPLQYVLAAFKKDASGAYQFLWLNDTLFPERGAAYIFSHTDDQGACLLIRILYDKMKEGYVELSAALTTDGWMVGDRALKSLRASDVLYVGPGPAIPVSYDGLSLSLQSVALEPGRTYDVYYGPDTRYERAAGGKGRLSTNDWVQVFGQDGDWLLAQYEVKEGQYRFGYIQYAALKLGETAESVDFASNLPVRAARNTQLTDDPLGKKAPIREIKEGMELRHLASIQNWFYVEIPAYDGQKAIRGFVPETAFIQKVTNMWYGDSYQMPTYTAYMTYGMYFLNAVYEDQLDTAATWQADFTVRVTGQQAGDEPIQTYRLYNDAGELVNESPISTIDPTPKINDTFFLGLSLDGARPALTFVPCYENTGEHQDEAITIQIR